MFLKIKCPYLQFFLNTEEVLLCDLNPIEKNMYKACDFNNNTFYFTFKKVGLSFENYKKEPAITLKNGTQIWMNNNRIHRENDLPAIFLDCDYEFYFKHSKPHRKEDKPAVIVNWCSSLDELIFNNIFFDNKELNGFKIWCKDGLIHRLNKPAFVDNIDNENEQYFFRNELFSIEHIEEFKKLCLQVNFENF